MFKYILSILLLFGSFGAYALEIKPSLNISPDWDFSRPGDTGGILMVPVRQIQSPEAVTYAMIGSGTKMTGSGSGDLRIKKPKVSDNADIKGMAKPEVGWRKVMSA